MKQQDDVELARRKVNPNPTMKQQPNNIATIIAASYRRSISIGDGPSAHISCLLTVDQRSLSVARHPPSLPDMIWSMSAGSRA